MAGRGRYGPPPCEQTNELNLGAWPVIDLLAGKRRLLGSTLLTVAFVTSGIGSGRVRAADAASSGSPLPEILVIGTTPVPGLSRDGSPSLTGALNANLSSVSINDDLDDPFQPDILYRGFEASPVLGTPQGLAVYQNGVRINEAFGNTVNWDLFPEVAIDQVQLLSASPLYGLNALGGAVSVTMKNGFSYRGGDVELSGGSYGQRSLVAQFGTNSGPFGFYGGRWTGMGGASFPTIASGRCTRRSATTRMPFSLI